MDDAELERVYLAKTDDELLALAGERRSLEPEQPVLWRELRRRKLTDSHLLHPRAADENPKTNLAFNLPAKVGAAVMLLAVGGFGLAIVIAAARAHQFFNLVLMFVFFWVPIFAVVAWATRRALRNRLHSSARSHTHEQRGTLRPD